MEERREKESKLRQRKGSEIRDKSLRTMIQKEVKTKFATKD